MGKKYCSSLEGKLDLSFSLSLSLSRKKKFQVGTGFLFLRALPYHRWMNQHSTLSSCGQKRGDSLSAMGSIGNAKKVGKSLRRTCHPLQWKQMILFLRSFMIFITRYYLSFLFFSFFFFNYMIYHTIYFSIKNNLNFFVEEIFFYPCIHCWQMSTSIFSQIHASSLISNNLLRD